jgi:nitroreductase
MKSQELFEIICNRRSIRKYEDREIENEEIEALLMAGMQAPSARNQQPWRFVVVNEKALLRKLHADIQGWSMLDQAAAAIVIVADKSLLKSPYHILFLEDCAACAQNILITACTMGLGACWLGTYPIPERVSAVRRVLGVPEVDHIVPFCVISLGYPAECPEKANRWNESRIMWNKWT